MEIIRLFHRVSHKLGKRKEEDEKKTCWVTNWRQTSKESMELGDRWKGEPRTE